MAIDKEIAALYPELVKQGSLANLLQATLRGIGSSLSVTDYPAAYYAQVKAGQRSSQVFVAAKSREFLFDFWKRGVKIADAKTPDIALVARAIDHWNVSLCNAEELASAFRFVKVQPNAAVYERGEEVEHAWQEYLQSIGQEVPNLVAFVTAAAVEPKLRQLFPFMSHDTFRFSRCTGYPFTSDTPWVVPRGQDQYEVIGPGGESLGGGNAAGAVALVVAALPPNCGAAVAGTAEDFLGG